MANDRRMGRKTAVISAVAVLAWVGAAQAQEEPPFPGEACGSSADCGSFEGCLDGVCTPLTPTDEACELDGDCLDDGAVCVDGLCWTPDGGGTGIEDLACAQDADCPEGLICEDGMCESSLPPPDDIGMCEADADCGDGEICVACYCMPAEGTCRADADCPAGQRCDLESIGWAGGSDGSGGEPLSCEGEIGYCGIDPFQVEPDARCEAFCALSETCSGGDGTVSSDDRPVDEGAGTESAESPLSSDECIGFCSYLLADADAGEEMLALIECVGANEGATCDEIATACGTEAEAVGQAAEDVPAGIIDDDVGGGGAGGATGAPQAESGSLGDLFGNAFGGEGKNVDDGADAGASGGDGTAADGSAEDDGGFGCTVSHGRSGGGLALALLALVGLGAARRRRRA